MFHVRQNNKDGSFDGTDHEYLSDALVAMGAYLATESGSAFILDDEQKLIALSGPAMNTVLITSKSLFELMEKPNG